MTLHGHTRIELTDVHTGAVEVVESDNLIDRKSTRLNSSHNVASRMPSSA